MPTVYITVPADAGEALAAALVDRRLAAAVHRLPISSVVWWEGDVLHNDEELLLAKTADRKYDDLIAYVESEHPYEVPCIERFDDGDAPLSFAGWRDRAVDDDWRERFRTALEDRFDADAATVEAVLDSASQARRVASLQDRDWEQPVAIVDDVESFSQGYGLQAGWNSWVGIQPGETSHLTVDAESKA